MNKFKLSSILFFLGYLSLFLFFQSTASAFSLEKPIELVLGSDASFESPVPPVTESRTEQTKKNDSKVNSFKANGKKTTEKLPENPVVEKEKAPAKVSEPSADIKPKEAINGALPSTSGKPETKEKPADEYIRGY